ncbi:hypothetical protein F5Y04DRAFT_281846 [Hypomontagnella monticulosa]|nr:hypothetical protein F5Y04DRAFT_281846 [Hypomontagnella monticulosa]
MSQYTNMLPFVRKDDRAAQQDQKRQVDTFENAPLYTAGVHEFVRSHHVESSLDQKKTNRNKNPKPKPEPEPRPRSYVGAPRQRFQHTPAKCVFGTISGISTSMRSQMKP